MKQRPVTMHLPSYISAEIGHSGTLWSSVWFDSEEHRASDNVRENDVLGVRKEGGTFGEETIRRPL